jgi:hypothetical protein
VAAPFVIRIVAGVIITAMIVEAVIISGVVPRRVVLAIPTGTRSGDALPGGIILAVSAPVPIVMGVVARAVVLTPAVPLIEHLYDRRARAPHVKHAGMAE